MLPASAQPISVTCSAGRVLVRAVISPVVRARSYCRFAHRSESMALVQSAGSGHNSRWRCPRSYGQNRGDKIIRAAGRNPEPYTLDSAGRHTGMIASHGNQRPKPSATEFPARSTTVLLPAYRYCALVGGLQPRIEVWCDPISDWNLVRLSRLSLRRKRFWQTPERSLSIQRESAQIRGTTNLTSLETLPNHTVPA